MASLNGDSENPPGGQSWQDFCERQAIRTSEQFLRDFLVFSRKHAGGNNSVPSDPLQFAKKFVEYFLQHFDKGVKRTSYYLDNAQQQQQQQTRPKGTYPPSVSVSPPIFTSNMGNETRTSVSSTGSTSGQNGTEDRFHDDYDDNLGATASPIAELQQSPSHITKPKGGLLRRLSFKNFRKRTLFHKHGPDESDASGQSQGSSHRKHKHSHSKLSLKSEKSSILNNSKSEIQGDIKKEGIVNVLTGEDAKGKSRWEKTRMVLMKASGGFLLEFFSPPKSAMPKAGLFCFLITEARVTTAMEMPDHENTFVLKGEGTSEFVIEAQDLNEMRSWLVEIGACINKPSPTTAQADSVDSPTSVMRPRLPTAPSGSIERNVDPLPSLGVSQRSTSQRSLGSNPPDVPPRIGGNQRPLSTHGDIPHSVRISTGALDLSSSPRYGNELDPPRDQLAGDHQIDQLLHEYPWFHGTLSRLEAAQLVLQQGHTGHGVFLVRQSETRKGEYVLTFNFQGRAKHLRMTINNDGQCRVQHLWFQTIFDMLEHFRTHPIPLDSGGPDDVTLTDYVVALERPHTPRGSPRSRGGPRTGSNPNLGGPHGGGGGGTENREQNLIFVGGSVREQRETIANVMREQMQGHNQPGQHGHVRAVDNPYTVV